MAHYDIIGDIHGFADPLIALLAQLGYQKNKAGCYTQPDRQVIFLGDFIDRGNQQKQVLDIVMKMVEQGSALAIMGNHEFNALAYHAKHPQTNQPLRSHNDNHRNQHQAFIDTYKNDPDELKKVLDWFKSLPLFLDLAEIRVIHACWNQATIKIIQSALNKNNCLNFDFLVQATDKNHPYYDAIEILLKGTQLKLPEGTNFQDSYGYVRTKIRTKWWSSTAKTYQDYAVVPRSQLETIPKIPLTDQQKNIFYADVEKPVFFGHYWMNGKPHIQKENAACLDYSVAKDGKLVAYRWQTGDKILSNQRFIYKNE